jgi:hypothetical protein
MTIQTKPAYNTGNVDKDNAVTVEEHSPYVKVGGAAGYRPGTIIPHVGGSTRLEEATKFNGALRAEIVSYGSENFRQIMPPVTINTGELPKLDKLVASAIAGEPVQVPQEVTPMQVQPVATDSSQNSLAHHVGTQEQKTSHDASVAGVSAEQLMAMLVQMLQPKITPSTVMQPQPQWPRQQPEHTAVEPYPMPPMPAEFRPPTPAYPLPPPQRQTGPLPTPRPPFVPVDSQAQIDAFRSLGIPNLLPTPQPPKTRVDFIADQSRSVIAFSHSAYYHWVAVAGSVLLLIADTRFDYPYWAPNDMGDNIFQVTVVGSEGQTPQTYDCRLCGAEFMFGHFRFFMLLVAPAMGTY